jgi:hypothetical protein
MARRIKNINRSNKHFSKSNSLNYWRSEAGLIYVPPNSKPFKVTLVTGAKIIKTFLQTFTLMLI